MAPWARRLIAGALVTAVVVLVPGVAASDPVAPRTGLVAADGTVVDGAWQVEHVSTGVYRITGRGIDITRWDAATDVTMLPAGAEVEIRFGDGASRVDTGFSFIAG